jgi:predicted component of type VI protein secretion system
MFVKQPVRIAFERRPGGLYVAATPENCETSDCFVLTVHADVARERLAGFSAAIGPIGFADSAGAIPSTPAAVELLPLPTIPTPLAPEPGSICFQIVERDGDFRDWIRSGGLAVQVFADLPGLTMKLEALPQADLLAAFPLQWPMQIPLVLRQYGIRIGVPPRTVTTDATSSFVLVVRAEMSRQAIQSTFPGMARLGSIEEIVAIVNLNLAGIGLLALPAPPPQLPADGRAACFRLDRSSDFYAALAEADGMAIRCAEEWPGLQLELWAVKDATV